MWKCAKEHALQLNSAFSKIIISPSPFSYEDETFLLNCKSMAARQTASQWRLVNRSCGAAALKRSTQNERTTFLIFLY